MQRYKITTGMYHDNEDNDHIGTAVEYDWFDREPRSTDFPGWDLEAMTSTAIIISRFDTDYDRSAEEHFPVYYSAIVEPDPEEEG